MLLLLHRPATGSSYCVLLLRPPTESDYSALLQRPAPASSYYVLLQRHATACYCSVLHRLHAGLGGMPHLWPETFICRDLNGCTGPEWLHRLHRLHRLHWSSKSQKTNGFSSVWLVDLLKSKKNKWFFTVLAAGELPASYAVTSMSVLPHIYMVCATLMSRNINIYMLCADPTSWDLKNINIYKGFVTLDSSITKHQYLHAFCHLDERTPPYLHGLRHLDFTKHQYLHTLCRPDVM